MTFVEKSIFFNFKLAKMRVIKIDIPTNIHLYYQIIKNEWFDQSPSIKFVILNLF